MYNPFNKGRYYRFFLESDSKNYTMGPSDLEVELVNGVLTFPTGFHAITYIPDVHLVANSAAGNKLIDNSLYSDITGAVAVAIPDPEIFDHMIGYVFGYFD